MNDRYDNPYNADADEKSLIQPEFYAIITFKGDIVSALPKGGECPVRINSAGNTELAVPFFDSERSDGILCFESATDAIEPKLLAAASRKGTVLVIRWIRVERGAE